MKKTRAPGAGRKAKDPLAGRRPKTAVTVHPDHRDALRELDTAELLDLGLAAAIPALRHAAGRPAGTLECLFVYEAISEAIRRLRLRRDMPAGLSKDEENLLGFLTGLFGSVCGEMLFLKQQLPE